MRGLSLLLCCAFVALIHAVSYDTQKNLAQRIVTMVHDKYDMNSKESSAMFSFIANMDINVWNIIKMKFMSKIAHKSSFIMVFGGSSVTAGHDGNFNASYPMVFKRLMTPLFESLGMKLEVYNIAQGANQCIPSDLCYTAMGHAHPDFVGWEQSFNCGHSPDIYELMGRYAAWKNAILYFAASGGVLKKDCEPAPSSEEWMQKYLNGEKVSSLGHDEVLSLRDNLHKWSQSGDSVDRFSSFRTIDGYKHIPVHGFNFWPQNKLCNPASLCNVNTFFECASKGGAAFTTKEFYSYGAGSGANWHPTIGMHQLRGDLLAYQYANILLDAMYTMERMPKSTADIDVDLQKYTPSIPKKGKHCSPYCDEEPTCFTNFMPHFNTNFTLNELVVSGGHGWNLETPAYSSRWLQYGYLDNRPYYLTSTAGAYIHFRIYVSELGMVYICGYGRKESLLNAKFYLEKHAGGDLEKYSLEDKNKDTLLHSNRKYRGDECTILNNIPRGEHILTVEHILEGKYSAISHIVTW